jgi:predicted PurR-regulated permease PerM
MATMATVAPEETSLAHSREQLLGQGVRWVSTWALRWIIIVAAAYVLGRVIGLFWSVLLPVVIALVLTAALEPLVTLLRRRASFGPALASITVLLLAFAVLGLASYLLAPSIGDQVTEIVDSVNDGLIWLQNWVTESDLATEAQVNEVIAAAQDRLQSSAATITQGVLVGLGAVTTFLINLVVIFVLSFFFLKDGDRFLPWLGGVLGPRSGYHVVEVGSRAWNVLGMFVRTQALVGFIDATLIGLALVIVGVPLAIPLAILTFFAAFAPIVGAVVVGALAVVVALVSNGWIAALVILAVVLVVQQVEGNVLLPYLQGKSLDLHGAVVLLSIVLGSTLFGVIGAFAAVPVAAVAAAALRYTNEVVVARTPPPGIPDEVVGPPGTVSDPNAAARIEAVREEEAADQEWEAEREWEDAQDQVGEDPEAGSPRQPGTPR